MLLTATLLNAILGGLWRRWLGGWGNGRRTLIMACGFLLTWPLWLNLPWLWAAAISAGIMLFWAMGHRFDLWTIVLRYPLFGAAYPILNRLGVRDWTAWAEVIVGAGIWGTLTAGAFLLGNS